jgi:hypothetical protein
VTVENEVNVTNRGQNIDGSNKREYFDYDAFWKDLIDRFLYHLLKRALPELYDEIDTSREHRLLDKEFRDILNTGDPRIHTSPHFADFVIEVPLKSGDDKWILLHCEAQGAGGGNLAERMFNYYCLIYTHYMKNPVALAIVTSGQRNEERFYSHSQFGTKIVYDYNSLILADLNDVELRESNNPIDLALYAAKCTLKAKGELQKFNYLRTLTDLLSERGWNRNDKRDLVLFILRIINLKDEMLQNKYWEYRKQLNKEGKLMYEPFLKQVEERMAEQRGMEKGKEEMARKLLENGISTDIIAKSADMPVEQIRSLVN